MFDLLKMLQCGILKRFTEWQGKIVDNLVKNTVL